MLLEISWFLKSVWNQTFSDCILIIKFLEKCWRHIFGENNRWGILGLAKKQLFLVYTQSRGFFHCTGIFPLYWVSRSPTKKIRFLAQFFRSAQLSWIFWLFDALLLYENCQNMHQNPSFWENCLFGVKKGILPKNKSCSKNLELL